MAGRASHQSGARMAALSRVADPDIVDVQAAARAIGWQIQALSVSNEQEVEKAFATLAELKADHLLVNPDPLF